jgi:hypothetical protein
MTLLQTETPLLSEGHVLAFLVQDELPFFFEQSGLHAHNDFFTRNARFSTQFNRRIFVDQNDLELPRKNVVLSPQSLPVFNLDFFGANMTLLVLKDLCDDNMMIVEGKLPIGK